MKEVLIITNIEQASPRVIGFIQNFQKYWYKPIILCPQIDNNFYKKFWKLENCTIYQTEDFFNPLDKILKKRKSNENPSDKFNKIKNNNIIKKIILNILKNWFIFVANFLNYPDSHRFWIKKAIKNSDQIIKNHKIKVIFSSSSPVSSHIVASKVAWKYKIKWVADFRDLWTQNHAYPFSSLRKKIEAKLEKKSLINSCAITTVSYPLVNQLRELHKNKNIYEITNWFFETQKISANKKNANKKFTISYTWQVYENFQKIDIILTAINNLITNNKINKNNIIFNYYWKKCIDFDITVNKYKLWDIYW